ncbi:hypothetical protein [Salsuginibacillus kocurii]|uniref:hypothetical protein n=1 Tax=Salsuginibacillus kocurii TaxID=427078 RepID=UPI000373C5E0|nr:hypothetical protein [Salsuginibacillus kocurii]
MTSWILFTITVIVLFAVLPLLKKENRTTFAKMHAGIKLELPYMSSFWWNF